MNYLIIVGFSSITYFDSSELNAIKLQITVIIWCKDWSMRYNLIHWYWQGTADEDREFLSCLIKHRSLTLVCDNKTYPSFAKIFSYKYRCLYFNLKVYIFLRFVIISSSFFLICGLLKSSIGHIKLNTHIVFHYYYSSWSA